MSHHHERTEKICLNCGADVHGRFCHSCGQENVEPKETAGHLIRHVIEDITHFDGKFFKTIKYLLTNPGHLASEYTNGRRMSHLHPVRMYLFTSAIFFIIISSLASHSTESARATFYRDSVEQHKSPRDGDMGFYSIPVDGEMVAGMNFPYEFSHNGVRVYDSLQNTCKPEDKDNRLQRYFFRRLAAAGTAYHHNPKEFMEKFFERIFHSFSKVFFLSLPLFALFLQLLYIRQKKFYFTAHAVFSLHFYCAIFLFLMAYYVPFLLVHPTPKSTAETIFQIGGYVMIFGILTYLLVAMHRFYRQEWYKTVIKFLLQGAFLILVLATFTIALFLDSMISLAQA